MTKKKFLGYARSFKFEPIFSVVVVVKNKIVDVWGNIRRLDHFERINFYYIQ